MHPLKQTSSPEITLMDSIELTDKLSPSPIQILSTNVLLNELVENALDLNEF